MTRLAAMALAATLSLPAAAAEVQGAQRWLDLPEIQPAVSVAPGGKSTGVRLCWVSVYSRDKTPTNLRAGPSREAKVVAVLPAERAEAGTRIGPEFQVIAGRQDWFLIRGAHWAGYDLPEKALVLGPAWMAANLASFTIESPSLRRAPNEAAETILKMAPLEGAADNWGPDSAKIERVHGCSGSFVDVSVSLPDGRKARGWATGLCGNQVTTCGGGHVVAEERAGGLYRTEASCREDHDAKACPSASR